MLCIFLVIVNTIVPAASAAAAPPSTAAATWKSHDGALELSRSSRLVDEGGAMMRELEAIVAESDVVSHGLLRCFRDGLFRNMVGAVRIFAANHFVYSRHFLRYLQAVADKIPIERIAAPILENMEEENGNYEENDLLEMESHGLRREWFNGIVHRDLAERFLNAAGLSRAGVAEFGATAGESFTQFMLEVYENATACEGLAVIGFAIEETVSTLYRYIWDGLSNHAGMAAKEFVFFPLHILVDDGHAKLLKQSLVQVLLEDPDSCVGAPALVRRVLERRAEMFDEVRELIEGSGGVGEEGFCPYSNRRLARGGTGDNVEDEEGSRNMQADNTWKISEVGDCIITNHNQTITYEE